jgi:hypothetical protein
VSKAPSSSHGAKKGSGSNVAIVVRGNEPPKIRRGTNPRNILPHIRRGTNPQRRKKRVSTSSPSPHGDLISRSSSSGTVSTIQSFESPSFVPVNVGPETFTNDDTDKEYKCSLCREYYSACSHDPKNPSLPFLYCKLRFWRQCIGNTKGRQDCLITNCPGTNHGKSYFELDEELIIRIIKKSCSAEDGEVTDNVAGRSRRNQSLTSGWVRHVFFNIACHIDTNSCHLRKYCKFWELLLQKLCPPDYRTHTSFEGTYPRWQEYWSIHKCYACCAQTNVGFAMCNNCSIETIFSRPILHYVP